MQHSDRCVVWDYQCVRHEVWQHADIGMDSEVGAD